jgi:hypothetical protein
MKKIFVIILLSFFGCQKSNDNKLNVKNTSHNPQHIWEYDTTQCPFSIPNVFPGRKICGRVGMSIFLHKSGQPVGYRVEYLRIDTICQSYEEDVINYQYVDSVGNIHPNIDSIPPIKSLSFHYLFQKSAYGDSLLREFLPSIDDYYKCFKEKIQWINTADEGFQKYDTAYGGVSIDFERP